jgi:N-methylhydantoinase B
MINCTRAGAVGGSTVAILPLLCYDIPWALGGLHRALNFITPVGTIINAEFPHGVSMGSIAGTWSATNAANNCIARMLTTVPDLQDRLLAGCVGSWTTVIASGLDNNKLPFVTMIMDCMAGGWGARSFADGVDTAGLMAAITGQCPNVETNEGFYPVLYLYRRETKDSGGPGEYRGGMGATSCWIPHDTDGRPIQLVLATFGQAFPTAFGVDGGYPANTAMYKMMRGADLDEWFARGEIPTDISLLRGELEYLPAKFETQEMPQDVFEHTWSGGGGYGDPLDRQPEKVLTDVLNDAVSVQAAEAFYGVVIKDRTIDQGATERKRAQIRADRIGKADVRRRKASEASSAERPISRHLVVQLDNNVACANCGHVIGAAGKNYKLQLTRKDNDVRQANILSVDSKRFIDPEMQFRQYFCPSCAVQVETEVILATSEPVWDKQLRIS